MYDNLEWIDLEIARGEGRESFGRYRPNPYGESPLGQAFTQGVTERMFDKFEQADRELHLRGKSVIRMPKGMVRLVGHEG